MWVLSQEEAAMSTYESCISLDAKQQSARPTRFMRILTGIARLGASMTWEWPERARQRRQLARLDDRMLGDIGLSRSDVDTEFRKAPWRQ